LTSTPDGARNWTRVATSLAALFALLNAVNALNKGGDAAVFFEGGRRFLAARPLYDGSSAADGFIGPPFQAMFFAPFAAVASFSPNAAKLLWHAVSILCLGLGVWLSVRAWDAARHRLSLRARPMLPMLFAPLFAVLLPLQTNFEHQNLNALLLALLAGATWQLMLGSAVVAGVLVGVATALKAFPALLVLYLAARRYWAAAFAATATAIVLTVAVPLPVYGRSGFADLLRAFWRLGNSGWPIRGNNQSLIAAIDRLTIGNFGEGFGAGGVRVLADAPLATILFGALAILLIATLVALLVTTPPQLSSIPCEIALVTMLAVLLSPIAWDHYWTLTFPALLLLHDSADRKLLGRFGRVAFWIAAILMTVLSPLTLGRAGFSLARDLSAYTIAGLVIYASLFALRRRLWRMERP
jgi:alpha-1,2-mannosyltransferase